ncbi:lysoplasmalogenase [Aeromicrobium sp.]|uniref:lysoplasmalogenase n=1 Tax=Aeromicrobium sp. TaxID=1871063 RepID=UPI003C4A0985
MDDAVKSPWIIGFGVVSVVHLVLNAADAAPWDSITKCLIAPLLAAWVLQLDGPRLLVAALLFCLGGDLFLEIESLFVVGMASFAAAHICFITFFVQRGALPRLRAKPLALIVYVAAAIAMVIWAWDGLEADVRPFVPVYALLLVGTAATSLALDRRAGLGGLLFLVSDGFIALGEAGRFDKDATWHGLVIMSLYILAIFFLSAGILNREIRHRRIAADGFDPTIRTDCWPRLPERA